jgi:hypothetical protein
MVDDVHRHRHDRRSVLEHARDAGTGQSRRDQCRASHGRNSVTASGVTGRSVTASGVTGRGITASSIGRGFNASRISRSVDAGYAGRVGGHSADHPDGFRRARSGSWV